MSKLQSKQEEYVKNQRADTIYRIITNKLKKDKKISPKKDSKISPKKDSKISPKKDSKISPKKDLSLESLRKDIIDKKKILLSDLPDDIIKIFVKKYKYKNDIYRPTYRITKKTPVTFKELSSNRISKARKTKYQKGRINRF